MIYASSFEEALVEIRQERTLQPGERGDVMERRIGENRLTELRFLRDTVIAWGSGEMSDVEIAMAVKKLSDLILVRKAAYVRWREENRAWLTSSRKGE